MGSGTCDYTANPLNQYTQAGGTTYRYDRGGNLEYDGHHFYQYDGESRLTKVRKKEQGPAPLSLACDTDLVFTTGGSAPWSVQATGGCVESDCARSGAIAGGQQSWLETTVTGKGTIRFYWSINAGAATDYLRFYIDGQLQAEITGYESWAEKSYYRSSGGTHTFKWVYVKSSGGTQDYAWVDGVAWSPSWGTDRTLADAVDSFLPYTTGGDSNWVVGGDGCFDVDDAQSGDLGYGQSNWLQTTVEGPGTFQFWWKVYSDEGDSGGDLVFRIDGVQQHSIDGSHGQWAQKTYTLGSGTHALKWTFTQQSQEHSAWGYVDHVEWSGSLPQDPPATDWRELSYVYDAAGRRVEKKYNNATVLKYVYDGDHCIAEYDGSNNLRRKYIYGPCVDEPISMIEAAGSYVGTY
jgi:YD repeat-containing protein